MIGTPVKNWLSFFCAIFVIMAFDASGILAASGTSKPETVKPAVQEPAFGSKPQEYDPSTSEWREGVITMAPHTLAKSRQTLIFINEAQYILSKNIEIVEKYEEKPGGPQSERIIGTGGLGVGKSMSYEVVGVDHNLIISIVISSIPHRQ